MADTVQTIKQLVAAKADTAAALAKEIWNYAELSYEETRSAAALIGALKNEGFTIEEGIAGIPTAFTATYAVGSGKPVVGFLAEYDALAGLSQKAACRSSTSMSVSAASARSARSSPSSAHRSCSTGSAGRWKAVSWSGTTASRTAAAARSPPSARRFST